MFAHHFAPDEISEQLFDEVPWAVICDYCKSANVSAPNWDGERGVIPAKHQRLSSVAVCMLAYWR